MMHLLRVRGILQVRNGSKNDKQGYFYNIHFGSASLGSYNWYASRFYLSHHFETEKYKFEYLVVEFLVKILI